jgi:hypothetical protein
VRRSARRWGPAARVATRPSTEARVLMLGPSPVSSAGLSSLLRQAELGVVGEAPAIKRALAMARCLSTTSSIWLGALAPRRIRLYPQGHPDARDPCGDPCGRAEWVSGLAAGRAYAHEPDPSAAT